MECRSIRVFNFFPKKRQCVAAGRRQVLTLQKPINGQSYPVAHLWALGWPLTFQGEPPGGSWRESAIVLPRPSRAGEREATGKQAGPRSSKQAWKASGGNRGRHKGEKQDSLERSKECSDQPEKGTEGRRRDRGKGELSSPELSGAFRHFFHVTLIAAMP